MKLLLDENLSPRLVGLLSDVYPGLAHVEGVGLGAADDTTVWAFARSNGLTIVSKDSDFADRSVLESGPPKVIWIRVGNCPTSVIERLLRSEQDRVKKFVGENSETCLLLGTKS